jgi:hypothetical protein
MHNLYIKSVGIGSSTGLRMARVFYFLGTYPEYLVNLMAMAPVWHKGYAGQSMVVMNDSFGNIFAIEEGDIWLRSKESGPLRLIFLIILIKVIEFLGHRGKKTGILFAPNLDGLIRINQMVKLNN